MTSKNNEEVVLEKFKSAIREFGNKHVGLSKIQLIFSNVFVDYYINCLIKLSHLNIESLFAKFKNQPLDTLIEIECMSKFAELDLNISPKINNKTPDFIVDYNRKLIFEVLCAKDLLESPIAKFEPGIPKITGGITHLLRMKLKDKIEKYSFQYPFIVIINKNYSQLDFDQLPYLDITDFMNHQNLSGFILYESTQKNDRIEIQSEIIHYKHARISLKKEEKDLILSVFVNN